MEKDTEPKAVEGILVKRWAEEVKGHSFLFITYAYPHPSKPIGDFVEGWETPAPPLMIEDDIEEQHRNNCNSRNSHPRANGN
jgi:hypothetical protein